LFATAVTDTVKFMDLQEFDIDDFTKQKVLRARRGNLSTGYNAVVLATGGKWKAKGYATYEDINYWMEMIFGVATPSGAGPYVRSATNPGAAAISPRIQTFYYGDAAGGIYKVTGGLASKLKISGNANEEVMWEAEGPMKAVQSGASFAALSDRAVTPITGNDFLLYIDPWGGTLGATAIASTFFSFEVEYDTKRDTKKHLGNLSPAGYKAPGWEGKLKMHLEFNTTSDDYVNDMIAVTAAAYSRPASES
jgi:hypothetical protein